MGPEWPTRKAPAALSMLHCAARVRAEGVNQAENNSRCVAHTSAF